MESASGSFLYLIKQIELGLRPHLEEAVSLEGMTSGQYTALTVLERRPGLTSSELARRSFVRAQTMAETIQNLTESGLIKREHDPENRRQYLLFLTPEGKRVIDALREPVAAVETRLLKYLDSNQKKAFARYLRACRDALGEVSLRE
ncbi:MarR family winged helix-turn-helix transcriptional regulator [Pseudarthrobacter sp. NPDC058329]|uniref:MarR family winged helix-turn-helix transcriptional regulator n=1 Tax=Pseudarthrobacter sp. NPDC058329 TaxID=3346448 RepID=UPI0036DE78CF